MAGTSRFPHTPSPGPLRGQAFSIADGIGFGFLAFVVIRAAEGRAREVHPLMWVSSAAFALYFLVPLLQDTFDWI